MTNLVIMYGSTVEEVLTRTPPSTKVCMRTLAHRAVHQPRPCTLTDIVIPVHPIDSSSVAPHTLGEAYHNHANAGSLSSLYAHGLPPYWVIPVVAQTVIPSAPLAHVTPLSSAPAPPPPQTQTPENDRRPGTQKEEDLTQLEQEIISSLWHAGNTLEPPCGSPDCPYIADCYGTRGMSCYTAFVIANPDGSSGCFWCPAYSARKLEDAVRHQRSNHFNHKPFVCVPINGAVW